MVKEKEKQTEKMGINKIMIPVKELPPSKRIGRNTLYDEILERAIASPEKIFRIDLPMKKAYVPLDTRIKKEKLPLKIRVRNKIIYLEKIN